MKSRILVLVLVALAALALPLAAFADESTPAAAPATGHEMKHHAAKALGLPLLDLNSASKEDLAKLPGVTDEIADKIIQARPFKARAELLNRKLVTRAEYTKLRAHVMVKASEPKKG